LVKKGIYFFLVKGFAKVDIVTLHDFLFAQFAITILVKGFEYFSQVLFFFG